MRVLGIDPALAGATGFGVVESDGRRCHSIHFGTLPPRRSVRAAQANAGAANARRLDEIHALVTRLVADFSPDVVAIESVFTALNRKTALKLAEVRGVVMQAVAQSGIPVHSYSPRQVKHSVAGYGNADKQQMQTMVKALLGMPQPPEPADAADALAVALCHIHSAEAQARFAAATGAEPAPVPASRRGSRARPARIQSAR